MPSRASLPYLIMPAIQAIRQYRRLHHRNRATASDKKSVLLASCNSSLSKRTVRSSAGARSAWNLALRDRLIAGASIRFFLVFKAIGWPVYSDYTPDPHLNRVKPDRRTSGRVGCNFVQHRFMPDLFQDILAAMIEPCISSMYLISMYLYIIKWRPLRETSHRSSAE